MESDESKLLNSVRSGKCAYLILGVPLLMKTNSIFHFVQIVEVINSKTNII